MGGYELVVPGQSASAGKKQKVLAHCQLPFSF